MNWIPLKDMSQLDQIVKDSDNQAVAIFKHSTTCSISAFVKKNLERSWTSDGDKVPVYYLDLLSYRPISNEIAKRFSVEHQSPQLILIKNGASVYDASHEGIDFRDMLKAA